MRKYWTFFIIEVQQAINHRSEALVWFLMELSPLVVMLNLAHYLRAQGRLDLSQYSLLVLYYLLNLIVSRICSIHFETDLIDDIKDGRISSAFLKPFSFYWHFLPRETACAANLRAIGGQTSTALVVPAQPGVEASTVLKVP